MTNIEIAEDLHLYSEGKGWIVARWTGERYEALFLTRDTVPGTVLWGRTLAALYDEGPRRFRSRAQARDAVQHSFAE